MSKRIFELAVPKGNVSPLCEICGNKATTKCDICRVTHYCTQDHKLIDSISFHKKVCKKLADIRSEHSIPFSEADRIADAKALLQSKQDVLKLAETVSKKWLLERKAMNAYPSAMIAWNMSREMRSEDSSEVIYPTCLVSEMFLRLGDISAAEQYMVQASWISQKYDVLPHSILSKLYRIRGLVFMALKNWEQARTAFAEFAYAVASEYGIADVRLGIPYGLLGLSLLKFDNIDGAMANFHKMADKWLDNLLSQYEVTIMRAATETEMAADEEIQELEFQFMEAKIVFELMYEMVRNLEMNDVTDLINFKILCFQVLAEMREGRPQAVIVYKEEALATATRTKQDKAVPEKRIPVLMKILGGDYLYLWERKHNRPRTIATKYLERIKAINV
ncbi:zinc finger MYND domain-containing protein 12 [Caerostris darwini]|uniref:Zinc finger MYND domain-containing protein 12 n=1 Tax=Caerostris darwini TaxID=1538125 RepID=A0AAV4S9R1_9ARAC|nr:zinc finger MYND domain-containing protein 12 [Caerostris darwini]